MINYVAALFVRQVVFPSGTKVVININANVNLNIDILASSSAFGKTRGLCGNFNGRCDDDLAYLNDGSINTDIHSNKCDEDIENLYGFIFHPANQAPLFSESYK